MQIRIHGGAVNNEIVRQELWDETPRRNIWYEVTMEVKWSENSDGYWKAWVRRRGIDSIAKLWVDTSGSPHPTFYAGYRAYFKCGTYHAVLPNPPGSVYYDRIVKGPTLADVALSPLEGVSL